MAHTVLRLFVWKSRRRTEQTSQQGGKWTQSPANLILQRSPWQYASSSALFQTLLLRTKPLVYSNKIGTQIIKIGFCSPEALFSSSAGPFIFDQCNNGIGTNLVKGIIHSEMNICCSFIPPQAIQYVGNFFFFSRTVKKIFSWKCGPRLFIKFKSAAARFSE